MSPFATARRRAEAAGAVVAQEVVARNDVVDLEALGAGIALAYVALQEAFALHDRAALLVDETALADGLAAGLARGGGLHMAEAD